MRQFHPFARHNRFGPDKIPRCSSRTNGSGLTIAIAFGIDGTEASPLGRFNEPLDFSHARVQTPLIIPASDRHGGTGVPPMSRCSPTVRFSRLWRRSGKPVLSPSAPATTSRRAADGCMFTVSAHPGSLLIRFRANGRPTPLALPRRKLWTGRGS